MIKLTTILLSVLLICCCKADRKKIVIELQNKANVYIDSVKIGVYGGFLVVKNLMPDSTYTHTIYDTIGNPKQEGAFNIVVVQKDSIVFGGSFGYYMDASDIKARYKIIIYPNYTISEGE